MRHYWHRTKNSRKDSLTLWRKRQGVKYPLILALSKIDHAEAGYRAVDPEVRSHVVVETFLQFKGLERPAIIITDVDLALEKPDYAKRMYIALTRAPARVCIIDSRDALLRDPILRPWLQDI